MPDRDSILVSSQKRHNMRLSSQRALVTWKQVMASTTSLYRVLPSLRSAACRQQKAVPRFHESLPDGCSTRQAPCSSLIPEPRPVIGSGGRRQFTCGCLLMPRWRRRQRFSREKGKLQLATPRERRERCAAAADVSTAHARSGRTLTMVQRYPPLRCKDYSHLSD